MISVSFLPLSDPDDTSALKRSPLDKCVKPYFSTILSHWVPLPLPGPPFLNETKRLKRANVVFDI